MTKKLASILFVLFSVGLGNSNTSFVFSNLGIIGPIYSKKVPILVEFTTNGTEIFYSSKNYPLSTTTLTNLFTQGGYSNLVARIRNSEGLVTFGSVLTYVGSGLIGASIGGPLVISLNNSREKTPNDIPLAYPVMGLSGFVVFMSGFIVVLNGESEIKKTIIDFNIREKENNRIGISVSGLNSVAINVKF